MTQIALRRETGDVNEAGAGDFSQLYRQHSRSCLRVALRVTRDHHHAQDAVQEAFLAFARDPKRFDAERGNIGAWLVMLTHRRAVDLVRREQARPRPTETPDAAVTTMAAEPDPETSAALAEQAAHVRTGLVALDTAKQQIIYMTYYLGYTQTQIAEATGMPLGTVKTRTRRALHELRASLPAHAFAS